MCNILDYTYVSKGNHEGSWEGAYVPVREADLPQSANIISSHVVYKVKTEEDKSMRLKARICPHGNRDIEKEDIRKDSATAQFDVIRLMLTILTFLPFSIGLVDIKGAYLQSGPIRRDIYVRPPREWRTLPRGWIWHLLKLPYGITEAGRQWAMVLEEWLLEELGMERVYGVSQMFLRRNEESEIIFILVKVTDDILFAGKIDSMNHFVKLIRKRFEISKEIIDQPVNFNGCKIEKDREGSISINMDAYMQNLEGVEVDRVRRKQTEEKVSCEEYSSYRKLAGELIWAGNGCVPKASFVGSYLQQLAPRLKVSDLTNANRMLAEMKDLSATLLFKKLKSPVEKVEIQTFSDASFNISNSREYGQTGIITGVLVVGQNGEEAFHMIDWASTKQRRVTHSS